MKTQAAQDGRQEALRESLRKMSRFRKAEMILLSFFVLVSMLFINTLQKAKKTQTRSSDLILTTQNECDKDIYRYQDAEGNPAYAADKGYATKIIQKTADGRQEKYYDANGKPAMKPAGYCGIRYVINQDGLADTIIYLGKDGEPADGSLFGYAIIRRQYDRNGRVTDEKYYDEHDRPVCSPTYGAEKTIRYDDRTQTETVTFLDLSGNPFMIHVGYATVVRSTDTGQSQKGITVTEFYFDEKGEPVALPLGQFAAKLEYNGAGLPVSFMCLDTNGDPCATKDGYTRKTITYYPDESVQTERYYDENGQPYALADGEYGIRYDEGGGTVYLDANGRDRFSIRRMVYNHSYIAVIAALVLMLVSALADRKVNLILLILYIGCIYFLTLMNRNNTGTAAPFALFRSYRHLIDDAGARSGIFRNIWLFIPLGTILYRLCPKKTVILVPLAFSVLIEVIQLLSGRGFCEPDDILSNALGGLIGYMTGGLFEEISRILTQSRRKRSRV